MPRSVTYVLAFAAAVSIVCGILVASSAVTLQERQQRNAELERKTNVLLAAGLVEPDEKLDAGEIEERFARVEPTVVDLRTGEVAEGLIEPATYDQQKAKSDPQLSRPAPPNQAGIKRVPHYAVVYRVLGERGETQMIVLPIEGLGLWSTLYGFIALDADTTTVRGLTYYQHGETPGLGGEVDNPRWKALWRGRRVYDERWQPVIQVVKGAVGPAQEAPHRVSGLSGATITSRAVTDMLRFWLGEDGFGPYLERLRDERRIA